MLACGAGAKAAAEAIAAERSVSFIIVDYCFIEKVKGEVCACQQIEDAIELFSTRKQGYTSST